MGAGKESVRISKSAARFSPQRRKWRFSALLSSRLWRGSTRLLRAESPKRRAGPPRRARKRQRAVAVAARRWTCRVTQLHCSLEVWMEPAGGVEFNLSLRLVGE
jgi:hypothetical protein